MKDNISIKKTLQESEESYLNVILKNTDGIVIVDRNRVVKFMNPAAEVLFALSADDFVGELFDFPLVIDDVTELSLIRKGQSPVDVEIHVVETNWGGESVWLVSLRDISSRMQTQEALRHAAKDWGDSFDAISDMVLVIDENFTILRANKAAADILGVEITKIPGQPCYRLIYKTETPPDYLPAEKNLEHGDVSDNRKGRTLFKGYF